MKSTHRVWNRVGGSRCCALNGSQQMIPQRDKVCSGDFDKPSGLVSGTDPANALVGRS